MFFWNSLAFSMIQQMLAIWSLVPLSFLKPAWTSGSSQFTYCWSLENFEHYFTSVWDDCNCAVVWTFFGIAFLWDWNENWPFPVLWPLLSFPNFLAMDGPRDDHTRDDHTKWNKWDREIQIAYAITYMWNLKCDTNELTYKIETNSQTQKTTVWLSKGAGGK